MKGSAQLGCNHFFRSIIFTAVGPPSWRKLPQTLFPVLQVSYACRVRLVVASTFLFCFKIFVASFSRAELLWHPLVLVWFDQGNASPRSNFLGQYFPENPLSRFVWGCN
eukprot:TRINITY_DN3332_c1_g1_i1.p1 TRINITY_DN3332_c1_g1~~TRINITY_DN3332_c1_g1_i1.p1  ORF type:complete len:109 (+),score=4.34 TRINITY_DN3332_c1_g1_i1:118-444(+)